MIKNAVTRRAGRILLTSFLVLQMLLGYVGQANLVQAQSPLDPIDTTAPVNVDVPQYGGVEQSIRDYLCVPDDNNLGTALYTCITKLYRFGIAFGAIALVFFVVFAGYMYISGGEAAKQKGKGMILSAVTGMVIILSSYVLLSFINPDLVKIKPIQPPIFTANNLPKCEDVGLGVNCVLPSGQVNYGGGSSTGGASGNMKQWQSLITTNAQAQGIEYCALYALVELESSANHLIVSNGPPRTVDPNHSDKKFYGLPFTKAAQGSSIRGHGIGLGQIFIYGPPGGPSNSRWPDPSTPSRGGSEFGFNRPLTITDLINPDTNLKAAAYHFAKVKMRNVAPGNYAQGYANYHGAGSINGVNVKEIYQTKYLRCKGL